MQLSGAQMNRGAPRTPQTHSYSHMSDYSIDMIQQDQVDRSFPSQISEPLMNRMTPENPQPYLFINMDDSSMNLIPQDPADPTIWKKHQECTSFTHIQHEELEALFSHTMFPDKNLQKELALKLNLPQSTLPSTSALRPSNWAWDSVITESPTSDVQMQDPQLERLVASVPALYSDAYDIAQIIKLYSFPDEDEISRSSFHCLYQYLSPTRPQLGEQSSSLSIFAGLALGLSPGQTWSSMTSWGFAAYSLKRQSGIPEPLQHGGLWISLI
ncbi:hypothetical protein HPG69_010435, partial [Diceros bicornis minor]